MTAREILLLGNPQLYRVSEEVQEAEFSEIAPIIEDLHDTMMAFREKYRAGRAIAAPQIGVMKRLIYMHVDRPIVFVNPILRDLSFEMMEVWDDCMCFPDLLVRVHRHYSCTIDYHDEDWNLKSMTVEGDLSELIQHEYDHLNGILAVSRAIDERSFALRSQRDLL